MDLSPLLTEIHALPAFTRTLKALGEGVRPLSLGLIRAARPPVIAALAQAAHARNLPLVAITARHDRALALVDEVAAWDPSLQLVHFPEPSPLFYEYTSWGATTIRNRLTCLGALAGEASGRAKLDRPQEGPVLAGEAEAAIPVVITSVRALMIRTLPASEFRALIHTLNVGQTVKLEKLLDHWVGIGYQSAGVVVEPGQFSRRGGIVDVWPPATAQPVRIELFGDEIDSIRTYDPATQRSAATVSHVTIAPAREALPRRWQDAFRSAIPATDVPHADADNSDEVQLPKALEYFLPMLYPQTASLLDYLPGDTWVLGDDWVEIESAAAEFEQQAIALRREQFGDRVADVPLPVPYWSWSELNDALLGGASTDSEHTHVASQMTGRALRSVQLGFAMPEDDQPESTGLGEHFRPEPRFGGQVKPFIEYLEGLTSRIDRAVVVTRQAQRLAEHWAESHAILTPMESPTPGAPLTFVQGALAEGWSLQNTLHVLTDGEIFGWARPERRRRPRGPVAASPEADFADFAPGDYVVHVEYGIGRFLGLVQRAVEKVEREYLQLEYAGGDEVYVPIHQADRVSRYIGAEGVQTPIVSRLGTADWSRAKERTRQAVEAVARDLLELYAKREASSGHAFAADSTWQRELEASFPYVETEDQLRAVQEVKGDMEREQPMDRLICGDVGYGKTEVALRAAFKAVMDGKQVAVLVPTTVLAQQHLHTFRQRLSAFPVEVDMLSRFRTEAEQAAVLERLRNGELDIVIGTHRLLQSDIALHDLGLLIIDEEQRFGVTHKETLRRLRAEVDVLTMTATPIPRTLYFSLTGLRDISTIQTPPEERLPIVTQVGPYQERLVRQAVLRELDRGGQVFFVHNRVQSIGLIERRLQALLPEARISVAHGQMEERRLAQVMEQFTQGELDILLCTSIIESGLDIPNANTLIVDRADTFGLSQLYQLRGRVGRGAVRAYAYFFHDPRHRPTPEAQQRLETIAEQTELGAGYSIAMRDLEMRGTGDVLGLRQHGHISAVGFHLYTRLLAQAVQRLKADGRIAPSGPAEADGFELTPTSIDLPIPTAIPTDYVPDRRLRLQLYRRMAQVRREAEVQTLAAELRDRFGPPPEPVDNLLFQLRLKVLSQAAGVESIGMESGQTVMRLRPGVEVDIVDLQVALGARVRVSKKSVWLPHAEDRALWRATLVRTLEQLRDKSRQAATREPEPA